MTYRIQLAQTIRHQQLYYRCNVIETASNRLIAVTPTLWHYNAGCGQAAAIGEAQTIVRRLEAARFCESMQSSADFAKLFTKPTVIENEGHSMVEDYIISFAVILVYFVIAAAIIG